MTSTNKAFSGENTQHYRKPTERESRNFLVGNNMYQPIYSHGKERIISCTFADRFDLANSLPAKQMFLAWSYFHLNGKKHENVLRDH